MWISSFPWGLLITLGVVALVGFMNTEAIAQVRQSASYQLQSDSINFGGGLSTSTNYEQESTFGEVSTGPSDSTSYSLRAGYQQMQEVYLALTAAADVVMTPSLPGIGGGDSNGSTTVTATTDSPSGYQLSLEFSAAPAMVSGSDTINDYTPAGSVPDVTFSIPASAAEFAFSPFGTDVPQRYQTNGSVCAVSGSASTTACWDTPSTTAQVIAVSSTPNHPTGTVTDIYFKVGIGSAAVVTAGSYIATSTVTLVSL